MYRELAGPAGTLEARLDEPKGRPGEVATAPRAAVVFAHPDPLAGGSMHTKAVYQGAKGLTRIGCAVLRFNFRGVGSSQGTWDEGRGEVEDFTTALDFMHDRYPSAPLWSAGFSFGSWVALETGADDRRVTTLIGLAPPVKDRGYTFERTLQSTKPKFLIQGDLDELCPLKDMWAFYARLKDPKELVVIDGGTHLFDDKTVEVGEALEDLLGDFD
jgi:alpha/beta superfamily hydrolase